MALAALAMGTYTQHAQKGRRPTQFLFVNDRKVMVVRYAETLDGLLIY